MVGQANQVIGGQVIESAEFNQVIDFQLRTTGLNVAVALLGFVQELAHSGLGQVAVFSNVADSCSLIHYLPLQKAGFGVLYYTQALSS